MDLRRNLVLCYILSIDLEVAKMKQLQNKKTAAKTKKGKTAELEAIQKKIDEYLAVTGAAELRANLTKQQKKLERKTVAVLKKVKFPQEKVIKLYDEKYGKLNFWYKNGRIFFLKVENDPLIQSLPVGAT